MSSANSSTNTSSKPATASSNPSNPSNTSIPPTKTSTENETGILMKGYLTKRGDVIYTWAKRYFILKNQLLFYFTDYDPNQSTQPRGVFVLRDCIVKDENSSTSSNSVSKPNCFSIFCIKAFAQNQKRWYYLQAPSEALKREWIANIRKAARNVMTIGQNLLIQQQPNPTNISNSNSISAAEKLNRRQSLKIGTTQKWNQVICITCASSTLGIETVKSFLLKGAEKIRCIIKQDHRESFLDLFADYVDVIQSDVLDHHLLETALDGVTDLVYIPPFGNDLLETTKLITQVIVSMKQKTLKNLVHISTVSTSHSIPHVFERMHRQTEEWIQQQAKAHSFDYVILRMNQPVDNFSTFLSTEIEQNKSFEYPFDEKCSNRASYITLNDVASCCVEVVVNSSRYARQVFTLTGPQSLSCEQVADILSKFLKRKISFLSKSLEEYKDALIQQGVPQWASEAIPTVLADGYETISPDVKFILHREPKTFEDFLIQELETFGGTRKPFICIVTYSKLNGDATITGGIMDTQLVETLLENGVKVLVIEYWSLPSDSKLSKLRRRKIEEAESRWDQAFRIAPSDFQIKRVLTQDRNLVTTQFSVVFEYHSQLNWNSILEEVPFEKLVLLTSCDIYSSMQQIKQVNHVELDIVKQLEKSVLGNRLHIVKLSLVGSDLSSSGETISYMNKIHSTIEEAIRKSRLDYSIIRSNICYQAFGKYTRQVKKEIVNEFAMMGHGKVSYLDARDVCDVILEIIFPELKERGTPCFPYLNQTFHFTGDEEYNLEELSAIVKSITGSVLSFDFHNRMVTESEVFTEFLSELLKKCNEGYFALITDDLKRVLSALQQKPRKFINWIRENKSIFEYSSTVESSEMDELEEHSPSTITAIDLMHQKKASPIPSAIAITTTAATTTTATATTAQQPQPAVKSKLVSSRSTAALETYVNTKSPTPSPLPQRKNITSSQTIAAGLNSLSSQQQPQSQQAQQPSTADGSQKQGGIFSFFRLVGRGGNNSTSASSNNSDFEYFD